MDPLPARAASYTTFDEASRPARSNGLAFQLRASDGSSLQLCVVMVAVNHLEPHVIVKVNLPEEGVVQRGLAGSSCSLHILLKGGCCRLKSRRGNLGRRRRRSRLEGFQRLRRSAELASPENPFQEQNADEPAHHSRCGGSRKGSVQDAPPEFVCQDEVFCDLARGPLAGWAGAALLRRRKSASGREKVSDRLAVVGDDGLEIAHRPPNKTLLSNGPGCLPLNARGSITPPAPKRLLDGRQRPR